MSSPETYDLVVIGSGPGGYVAAARAAATGLRTALVEKDPALGGTCLHRGCIPTKALLHAADVYSEIQHAHQIGITTTGVQVDWTHVQRRKRRIVDTHAGGVQHLMSTRGVQKHQGIGRLLGPGQVQVQPTQGKTEPYALVSTHVLLAVGSTPRALPQVDFDHPSGRIVSSDGILELDAIPGSLLIVGGGVIGVEFASLFVRFGCKVTIVEGTDRLLPTADKACSQELQRQFKKQGVFVHTEAKVTQISANEHTAQVAFQDSTQRPCTCEAECVLVAIGRSPCTRNIGLETTQAQCDANGFIAVDGFLQTHQPSLYAIGDCVNTPWLAHVASTEGIVAVQHMAQQSSTSSQAGLGDCSGLAPLNYDHMPSCVYSSPAVAQCGLTECQARQKGYDITVKMFPLSHNAKASIVGSKEGFVKCITEKRYGEILGVHIVGHQATELIAEPSFAMQLEATVEDIACSVHAHPTMHEAIYEAACMAVGRPVHGN